MTSLTGEPVNNTLKQAFTLIELCIVILVLSIIVSVATPKFRNTYETIKFRSTVYNIAKLMNYARDRAIIERKPVRLRFSKDDDSFFLETLKKDEEESDSRSSRRSRKKEDEYEIIKGSIGQKMFFPKGVEFDLDEPDRQDYVTFYPDGQSDECVLYIKGEGRSDVVYTITTKKMAGLVKIYNEKKKL